MILLLLRCGLLPEQVEAQRREQGDSVGEQLRRAADAHAPVQVDNAGVVEPYFIKPLRHALSGDKSGGGLDALRLSGQTVFISVAGDAPRAVAAHLAQTAV